jgi:hypothetical protein
MTLPDETRPLGVRLDLPLTADQLRGLRVLEQFDLTPVRNRLLSDGALPESWVEEALLEFRRFLGLQLIEAGPRIMFSQHVDRVWHTSLLFTRLYADLCQQSFGYFFHHEPASDSTVLPAGRFEDFAQLYRRAYGEPSRLWYLENQGHEII